MSLSKIYVQGPILVDVLISEFSIKYIKFYNSGIYFYRITQISLLTKKLIIFEFGHVKGIIFEKSKKLDQKIRALHFGKIRNFFSKKLLEISAIWMHFGYILIFYLILRSEFLYWTPFLWVFSFCVQYLEVYFHFGLES